MGMSGCLGGGMLGACLGKYGGRGRTSKGGQLDAVFWMKDLFARGFCMGVYADPGFHQSFKRVFGMAFICSSVHLFIFSSFLPLAHEQGKKPVYGKDAWI
jgi:hypothetical protein